MWQPFKQNIQIIAIHDISKHLLIPLDSEPLIIYHVPLDRSPSSWCRKSTKVLIYYYMPELKTSLIH